MSKPVVEGELLARKYRDERVLEVLTVPEAVSRFLREARAAVRVKSEHNLWRRRLAGKSDGRTVRKEIRL